MAYEVIISGGTYEDRYQSTFAVSDSEEYATETCKILKAKIEEAKKLPTWHSYQGVQSCFVKYVDFEADAEEITLENIIQWGKAREVCYPKGE